MNNMDEDIYVKREKNITVEGSKVPPRGRFRGRLSRGATLIGIVPLNPFLKNRITLKQIPDI